MSIVTWLWNWTRPRTQNHTTSNRGRDGKTPHVGASAPLGPDFICSCLPDPPASGSLKYFKPLVLSVCEPSHRTSLLPNTGNKSMLSPPKVAWDSLRGGELRRQEERFRQKSRHLEIHTAGKVDGKVQRERWRTISWKKTNWGEEGEEAPTSTGYQQTGKGGA